MEKIALNNYRTDKFYPRIVKAVDAELQSRNFVTLIEVFTSMGLLERRGVENWRVGRIPNLEQVVGCNLSKASRILRILRCHAHDLNLKLSMAVYKRMTPGGKFRYDFPSQASAISKKLTQGISSRWGNSPFAIRRMYGIRPARARIVNREVLVPRSSTAVYGHAQSSVRWMDSARDVGL